MLGKLTEYHIDWICNLTELYLCDNRLTVVPEFIGNLTLLTELILECNQLTEIPESIVNLTNLTYLDLRRNRLKREVKTRLKEIFGDKVQF